MGKETGVRGKIIQEYGHREFGYLINRVYGYKDVWVKRLELEVK